jgi:hypothetical protein
VKAKSTFPLLQRTVSKSFKSFGLEQQQFILEKDSAAIKKQMQPIISMQSICVPNSHNSNNAEL